MVTAKRQRPGNPCILAIFIATGLFLQGCGGGDDVAVIAPALRAVKTVTAGQSEAERQRVLSGYLQARRVTQLSFQVEGHVLEVFAAPGDQVTAKTLLARIDPKPFELRVQTAEAELKRARADLRESRENYESQKRVYDQDYISKTSFEKVAAAYSRAESSVASAESSLALARRDLDHTHLGAPFDGVITKRDLEPFQVVGASRPVFEMQGETDLEVSFLLPADLADKILIGHTVSIALPSAGLQDIPATITERSIEADTKGSFPVVATVQEQLPGLMAGVAVEVYLTEDAGQDSLLLPESAAAIDENGRHYVFVYDPASSVVRKRHVNRVFHSADRIAILEGVGDGEIVVVAGVEFLRDGQKVVLYQSPGIAAVPTPAEP